jgi:uracil-DNA glycosylase
MTASDEFAGIAEEIADHPSNSWALDYGYRPLFTASATSRIAIIGQAPGRRAQESGIPWNDPSGVKLRNWLGITEEQFYDPGLIALLPMDFFYPGKGTSGDLPPRKDFAPTWHPRILAALPDLRLTVLIGGYAQKYYLQGRAQASLTETVRAYRDYLPGFIPLVHPSPLNFRWQAKNPWFETEVIPQLRTSIAAVL